MKNKILLIYTVGNVPYHRQKKIEKEEEQNKRIINGSDKYKYPGNDHIPNSLLVHSLPPFDDFTVKRNISNNNNKNTID